MDETIYCDYASTTPVDPAVIEAMRPFWRDRFGNPSSAHRLGQEARRALERVREETAALIGADPSEVVFTSGATEANNHVVFGCARALKERGRHIVVGSIEHPSVAGPVEYLERWEGVEVTRLAADAEGRIDPGAAAQALRPDTILLAVMHANNEIGTIQDIEAIGRTARERGVPFLVDAVQTAGHIPVDVSRLGADFLSLSAHKFYGPKGIGALYIRRGARLAPLLLGGDQEDGRRASTQNVPGAVGMGTAASLCRERMEVEGRSQMRLRDRLLEEIPRRIPDVKINGSLRHRLPNNVHVSFAGVPGEALLMALDAVGITASMGSACKAGAMAPSRVLRAIGLSEEMAMASLRLTFGRWSREEDAERILDVLPDRVRRLRA